jgi:hypothetical protein
VTPGSTFRWLGSALFSVACAASPAPTIGITPASALAVEPATKPSPRTQSAAKVPSTLVVFGIERDGLLPIACYDGNLKRAQGGVDCLDLVPEGDSVVSERGQMLVVGKRQDVSCPRGHTHQPGFALAKQAESETKSDFAIWPKNARGRLSISAGSLKPGTAELDELEALLRQTLDQESTDTLPASRRALVVFTGESVDFDGDGIPDRVFSGVVDSLEGLRFTGLLGFLSTHGGKPSIIHRDQAYTYYLRGSVDLDGAGGRELLVTRALVEHSSGAPTQLENAVGILHGREYRFLGLPCSLLPEGG